MQAQGDGESRNLAIAEETLVAMMVCPRCHGPLADIKSWISLSYEDGKQYLQIGDAYRCTECETKYVP